MFGKNLVFADRKRKDQKEQIGLSIDEKNQDDCVLKIR